MLKSKKGRSQLENQVAKEDRGEMDQADSFILMGRWCRQVPPRQTCSGPAPTVHLREVSALKGDEVNN